MVKPVAAMQLAFSCAGDSNQIGFKVITAVFAGNAEQTMINLGAGLAKIAGMVKMGAGLPALAGVIVAVTVGTYFIAPDLFRSVEETGSQPAQVSGLIDGSTTNATPPSETAASEIASVADPEATAMAEALVEPSFDLLRVEPDGSTVIAGKAQPGTRLDIMSGETVIASTRVGESGDFATVLDTPLAAGDHLLTLRNTGDGGVVRQSEEVATVSVPDSPGGELLAMVSKPGKASRIMAQPVAPALEQSVAEPAAGDSLQARTETGETQTAAAATEATDEQMVTPAVTASGESPAFQTPALPGASAHLTTSAPQIAPRAGTEAASQAETATETAMAAPEPQAATTAVAMPADATVRVDAVEIEGDRIFIAGSATPGFPVRVSANGVVIGTEKADATGRFIIEATGELAVGDHIINADLMDKSAQTVLLRATVPFDRPEGEALAAVAPPEPEKAAMADGDAVMPTDTAAAAPAEAATQAAPDALISPDAAGLSKPGEGALPSEPSGSAGAGASAPAPVAEAAGQSDEPRTIVQAPLASSPGAVIIRRGDTLWQISRRTYGQGVRYTTIYVANQSQIVNPHRIKPGQVFSVPESPLDNAEELHRQLLDAGKKS